MTRDKDSIYRDLQANQAKEDALRESGKSGADWHAANLSIYSEKARLLAEYHNADPTVDIKPAVADAERQRSWSRRKLGLDD